MHSLKCFFDNCTCPKLQEKISQLSEAVTSLHTIAIHQQATIECLELRLESQRRLLLTRSWGRNLEPQSLESAPPIYKEPEEVD
jgi:hypothetical protein